MAESSDEYQEHIRQGILSLFGPWSEHVEELEKVIDGPISLVRARTMNGSISVHSGSQRGVAVRVWKSVCGPAEGLADVLAERIVVHIEQQGETLSLFAAYPGLPLGCRVFVHYEIVVPYAVDVDIYTHNGGISVVGVEGAVEAEAWSGNIALEDTTGPAKLYTSNGTISIAGLEGAVDAESGKGAISVRESSGRARLRTTDGDITVASSDALVEARSSAGDIEVQDGRGSVDLQTGAGDVRARFANLSEAREAVTIKALTQAGSLSLDLAGGSAVIDVEAVKGSISLCLPSDFAGHLEAGTRDGVVACALPLHADLTTRNLLTGYLGQGGQGRVRVQTFAGDIHIRACDRAGASPTP